MSVDVPEFGAVLAGSLKDRLHAVGGGEPVKSLDVDAEAVGGFPARHHNQQRKPFRCTVSTEMFPQPTKIRG